MVLYSDLADSDWPDVLDVELGRFTYWGDNKRAGQRLSSTKRGGNLILQTMFDRLHGSLEERKRIPPFFVFTKGSKGRDVVFRGLAVPGAPGVTRERGSGRGLANRGQRASDSRTTGRSSPSSMSPWSPETWIDDLVAGDTQWLECAPCLVAVASWQDSELLTAPASFLSRSEDAAVAG